jgi:hypothetical protein
MREDLARQGGNRSVSSALIQRPVALAEGLTAISTPDMVIRRGLRCWAVRSCVGEAHEDEAAPEMTKVMALLVVMAIRGGRTFVAEESAMDSAT